MNKPINRRKAIKNIVKGSAVLYGASVLESCNFFIKKNTSLTSGYLPILDSTPLIVAHEKGFFKDNDIESTRPTLIRAWPALYEAFTSGQINLTHILLPQVIFQKYSQGINLKSVAFNHTDVVAMLIGENYDSLKDLGGQIVGCPTWWAPHTSIFQDVLRKAGLSPVVGKNKEDLLPNEVAFRVVAPPDMPEALLTNAIAGCTVSEPFGAVAELKANAKLVKMSGDVWQSHPCCQSVMLEKYIEEDRERAQGITNALYKGALWAHENKDELAEMLGTDGGGYFPMPIAAIKRALKYHDLSDYGPEGTGAIMHTDWGVNRVEFNPFPFESAFDITLDLMRRTVVDPSVVLPNEIASLTGKEIANDIVDYDLAKTAYKEVGGKKSFLKEDDGLDEFEREEKYEVLLKDSIL